MAKSLSNYIQNRIDRKDLKIKFVFKIDGTDYSDYLLSYTISFSTEFGSATATFILNNNDGVFGQEGELPINVGDTVSLSEYFSNDLTNEWKKFYGVVNQRTINKQISSRTITLTCLDYISTLEHLDIDLICEGEKVKVENETLVPNYLPSPNDSMAQIFNFANNSLADKPLPLIMIRDKNHLTDDPQYDGFEIIYDTGQLRLGSPLNALDNYDVVAKNYYFYVKGEYIEDVLEEIITLEDGYGGFLFGETSAQAVIDNHLTDSFLNVEGTSTDYLVPNYKQSEITIETTLTVDYDPDDSGGPLTYINVEDTSGFPTSGEGSINGDIFIWSNKTSTTLTGIPISGEYSLNAHKTGSYVKYTYTYDVGQVWYLKYSNLVDDVYTFSIDGNYYSVYTDLTNTILSQYKLNDNLATTNVIDNSTYSHNMVASKNTSLLSAVGKMSNCFDFVGDGDYCEDSDAENYLNGVSEFSISVWVKSDAINTDRGIFASETPDGGDDRICLRFDAIGGSGGTTNCMKGAITVNGSNYQFESSGNVQTTEWLHLVYQWESGGPIELYINSVRNTFSYEQSATITGTISGCTTFILGKGTKDDGGTTSWNGKIDNCIIFNKKLSINEIKFLYNSGSGIEDLSSVTISKLDKRYGRIILDSPISITSIVTSNIDYSFKTLQASGIEINYISFKPREVANRFEAIKKLRNYVAPNYLIFTLGDSKIWSKYLSQRVNEDYDLDLIQDIAYQEDSDLYTRVIMYAKNKNPTNILFNEGVDFVSSGETYKALASNNTLYYDGEDGDYYIYKSVISNAGYIDLEDFVPIVYINGYPIDNTLHLISATPCVLKITTRTETKSGCHGVSKEGYTKSHTYYYYDLHLAHSSIEPSKPIYFYDAFGELVLTVSAYDINMDYAKGIYCAPGSEQNSVLESVSTASYYIFYSLGNLIIDYDNVIFKVKKSMIGSIPETVVSATYEYWTTMTAVKDVASIIDGRWDTQVQTEFFAEPPSDYNYAILDLGQEYTIQAIDIIGGFFKPDLTRKYDIDFNFTLQYSSDNVSYYNISDKTYNVQMTGGSSVSFEEDDLGVDFSARYLKILLTDVEMIDYGADYLTVNSENKQHLIDEGYADADTAIGTNIVIREGLWAIAFSELSAYDDVIIKSNVTLIPTTYLSSEIDLDGLESTEYPTTIYVDSTEGFSDPESGQTETAYIDNEDGTFDEFTYTGLTSTSFTGVDGLSSSHDIDDMIVQELEGDDTVYDYKGLRPKMGDRIYKDIKISDDLLMTQEQLDYLAKQYLLEYIKDHTKLQVNLLFCPYINIGNTVHLVDTYNNIDRNYFVESITNNNGMYSLTIAYYPNS